MESEIEKKEKWITLKTQKFDEFEKRYETINTSVLTGAEKERGILEILLRRRRLILGQEDENEEAKLAANSPLMDQEEKVMV